MILCTESGAGIFSYAAVKLCVASASVRAGIHR